MSGVARRDAPLRASGDDAAGNKEYPGADRVWTVGAPPPDTTAPETTITRAPPDVTAAHSAASVRRRRERRRSNAASTPAAWSACGSPADVAGLTDGAHRFDVRAIDGTGNVDASPASWGWTVDTRPPQARAALAAGSGPQARLPLHLRRRRARRDVRVRPGPRRLGALQLGRRVRRGLGAGAHKFRVRATDAAGNLEPGGAPVAFTVSAERAAGTTSPRRTRSRTGAEPTPDPDADRGIRPAEPRPAPAPAAPPAGAGSQPATERAPPARRLPAAPTPPRSACRCARAAPPAPRSCVEHPPRCAAGPYGSSPPGHHVAVKVTPATAGGPSPSPRVRASFRAAGMRTAVGCASAAPAGARSRGAGRLVCGFGRRSARRCGAAASANASARI